VLIGIDVLEGDLVVSLSSPRARCESGLLRRSVGEVFRRNLKNPIDKKDRKAEKSFSRSTATARLRG